MSFSPEWFALGREADLAADQIGAGVTALGKANHAQKGYYTQGFFGLSIGFERLAKLIVICDHAISTNGQYPTNDLLKSIGHDLIALLDRCEEIERRVYQKDTRPRQAVHPEITRCLSEFAKLTRYYNLDLIVGGRSARSPEPINAWWENVGSLVLKERYSERIKLRDSQQAEVMEALLGPFASVLHHNEDMTPIDSIGKLATKAAATALVQTYGRLHTLQIVRWLSNILSSLSSDGAYKHRIEALLGLDERFIIFRNPDEYLKRRKTWSIYKI
jgi:hypothetical protein